MAKKTLEMARLRQVCCLRLASCIVMPQILNELHQIVMADQMNFAWCDPLGNIVNAYFEKPDAAVFDYLKHNHQRFQEDAGMSFRQALLFGKITGNFRWPFKPGFEFTQSHERLFAAMGLEHSLDGVVRDSEAPLGQVFLLRRKGEPPFSDEDGENLAQCLPYIAHAISHQGKSPDSFVESGHAGLLVFDAAGHLQSQSLQARELCLYALAGDASARWEAGIGISEMENALHALFDRVKHAFSDEKLHTELPAWTVANQWGEFQLRAYMLLESCSQSPSYGVILKKKMPVEVWLLQKIRSVPLSNKQREVCFFLARGVDTGEIAKLLGITQTTLKEHIKMVYRKLGICKREDLLRFVLS